MGAVGRAKTSDKKSMRLATAAASIFRGSVRNRALFFPLYPSLELTIRTLSGIRKPRRSAVAESEKHSFTFALSLANEIDFVHCLYSEL